MSPKKKKKTSNQQWNHLGYFAHLIVSRISHLGTKKKPKLPADYSHDLEWWRPPLSWKELTAATSIRPETRWSFGPPITGCLAVHNSSLWPMYGIWEGVFWGEVGGPWDTRGSGWVQNEMKEAVGSMTTPCLFVGCLQIDLHTFSSATVYFSWALIPPLLFIVLFL